MRPTINTLLAAVLTDDRAGAKQLLRADPSLATQQITKPQLCQREIFHWLYAGDTALHLAAAGYRVEIVRLLLAAGADPNAASNHRRSGPLHYAADGYVSGPAWNPQRQVKTIRCLLDAGAGVNAQDKNGAAALHRAVRTRCTAAVRCLLDAGANPQLKNKSGSTAFHLAVQNTGRGGSGDEVARDQQRQIIAEFLARGLNTKWKDGKGKTVIDCAQSAWIKSQLLPNSPLRASDADDRG